MAHVRSTSLTRAGLAGFGALGAAEPTRPSLTGIESVDRVLYKVSDSLDNLNMALNITTVASTVAALAGVLLLVRTRK